jgi:hypothetical protein
MNSASPSALVGGFEVLEIPDDPYHGQMDRPCSCQSCDTASANPAFFEYFTDASSARSKRVDAMTLVLILAVSAVLFCIITNLTSK